MTEEYSKKQPDQLFVPKNTFNNDPFAHDTTTFFSALSEKTGVSSDIFKEVYRLLPESFLASTVAQAAVTYMELVKQGKQVAFFSHEDIHKESWSSKLGSSEVMTLATVGLLEKLGFTNVYIRDFTNCTNFDGIFLIVEDVAYTGEQLVRTVSDIKHQNTIFEKIIIMIAASSREALTHFNKPKIEITSFSLIPEFKDVLSDPFIEKLRAVFGRRRCFVITQHKLPDNFSLLHTARSFRTGKGERVTLYQENPDRRYPKPEDLAEKAYQLFL